MGKLTDEQLTALLRASSEAVRATADTDLGRSFPATVMRALRPNRAAADDGAAYFSWLLPRPARSLPLSPGSS